MTDGNSRSRFYINDQRLFHHSSEHGHREFTHSQRTDGGGIDYLELRVSGQEIVAGHSVEYPVFTLTLSPDGQLEGERPGGYEYAWIISEK